MVFSFIFFYNLPKIKLSDSIKIVIIGPVDERKKNTFNIVYHWIITCG